MLELTEARNIQEKFSDIELSLEWTEVVMARLRGTWSRVESDESLAYEDKVAAQLRILEEATPSLWHLHRWLIAHQRELQKHHRQLKHQPNDP